MIRFLLYIDRILDETEGQTDYQKAELITLPIERLNLAVFKYVWTGMCIAETHLQCGSIPKPGLIQLFLKKKWLKMR